MIKIVTGRQVLGLIRKHTSKVHHVWVVSPFLSEKTVANVMDALSTKDHINLTVITKWEPLDLLLGYSDIGAFDVFFAKSKFKKWNIDIFITNTLHAKVFMLGKMFAVIGSMNLTNAGLSANAELGVAISNAVSELNTLQRSLEEIKKRAYLLTSEAYKWKREHELPHFENGANALRSLIQALQKQRDAGLQSFVPGKDETDGTSYFGGVVRVLKYIDSNRPTWDALRDWLNSIAVKGGGDISQTRLDFLSRLGLIFGDQGHVRATPLALEVCNNNDVKLFSELLFGAFPELVKLVAIISENLTHPHDVFKTTGFGNSQYWAVRLRWLSSIGQAVVVTVGKKKLYRYNAPNVTDV